MTVPILHTIWQERPDRLYYLNNLKYSALNGVWNLGLPNLTTQDELVLERGVFQHGSTLAVVRLPPTREFSMTFVIPEDCSLADYYNARSELIEIFNPIHLANAQTSGVVPTPFTYCMTLPDGRKRCIRFAYRSGLDFDEQDAPDHRSFAIKVRLMSPDITLFDDPVNEEVNGNTSAVDGSNDILNVASPPFVYQGSWPARFRLVFQRAAAPAIATLYALVLRDVTNSFSYRFKHVDYPGGGWDFAGVGLAQTFEFDSRTGQEIFVYSDLAPQTINLANAAHPDSDWRDFQFYPGIEYEIYLETDTAGQLVVGLPFNDMGLTYRPTYIGI